MNNAHNPGFTTPLEESAFAEELDRIKNDPRRRAIVMLENEELAATRAIANADALIRRNIILRKSLTKELLAEYTTPKVKSFVPDADKKWPIKKIAVAAALLALGIGTVIVRLAL